jgi:hypothetical protein
VTPRTVIQSSFDAYIARAAYPPEVSREEVRDRRTRLDRFPHSVMLELAFPELDCAERWCWQHIGPIDGECRQKYSEYRVCFVDTEHVHVGKWTSHWYEKTDYDFGYCEFYFLHALDRDRFAEQLPDLNWGEKYPK